MNPVKYAAGRIAAGLEWRMRNYIWKIFEARLAKQDVINREFDLRHGTETAVEHRLDETGVPSSEINRGNVFYRPFWESDFQSVIEKFSINFSEFTFVDIGSGKGKLLMLASKYPFKKFVGVEYSPGLHEIAQKNIAIFAKNSKNHIDFDLILGDAQQYQLPKGAVFCLVFNSMDSVTTRKVLLNFDREAAERSAPVFIIYANLRNVSEIGQALTALPNLKRLYRSRKIVILGNQAAAASGGVKPRFRI